MSNTIVGDGAFESFVAASGEGAAVRGDVLDRVSEWLLVVEECVEVVHRAVGRVKLGVEELGRDVPKASFLWHGIPDVDGLRAEAATTVVGIVEHRFLRPQCVMVESVRSFIIDALARGALNARKPSRDVDIISEWDAEKVRMHFRRVYGDPREAAISQLRAAFLKHCGYVDRPGVVLSLNCGAHGGASLMQAEYPYDRLERLQNSVRFITHLATGEAPAAIVLSPVVGLDKKACPRKDFLKRQNNPFPGALWARFNSDRDFEVALKPEILMKVQHLWDGMMRDE